MLMLNETTRKATNLPQDKDTEYFVYWAHLPTDTDPYTTGYIGQTKCTLNQRISRHHYDAFVNEPHKKASIYFKTHWNELIWTVLFIGSYEDACDKECQYRPECNIGANSYGGGHKGRRMNSASVPQIAVNLTEDQINIIQTTKHQLTDQYNNSIKQIQSNFKLNYIAAQRMYVTEHGSLHVNTIKSIAKQLSISYSEARRSLSYCNFLVKQVAINNSINV